MQMYLENLPEKENVVFPKLIRLPPLKGVSHGLLLWSIIWKY